MLHSTILKQQQKDKKKNILRVGTQLWSLRAQSHKSKFGIVQVWLAWERASEFNTESSDSEDPESNEEILFEAWSHETANGGQRT